MIANKINRGSTEISKAYLNGQIVYSSAASEPFTATYQIDDISKPLTLPVSKDYQIDWGDSVTTTTGNQHFYASIGVKTVNMFGVVDDFRFANGGDKLKILTVENWGGFTFVFQGTFYGCSNLSQIPSITIKQEFTSLASAYRAFYNCPPIYVDSAEIDLHNCNTLLQSFGSLRFINGLTLRNTSNIIGWRESFRNTASDTNLLANFHECDFSIAGGSNNGLFLFMSNAKAEFFSYQQYDLLLQKWAKDPSEGGLDISLFTNQLNISMGTVQYSSAGAEAHDYLVSQGFIITDGGQNAL